MSLKFLIVDDSSPMQIMIKRILFGLGYSEHKFRFADDGDEAIHVIKNWQPDIVILDWHMNEVSGLDVLKKVKKLDLKIKIGFITAETDQLTIDTAKQAGAMFVIHKPFTMVDIQKNLIPVIQAKFPEDVIENPAEELITLTNESETVKNIIFPATDALSMLFSIITGTNIKVEKINKIKLDQLSFPCKVALFGNNQRIVKAVQVLDSKLVDRLAGAFATSVYKHEALDAKLLEKASLRSLTIVGACFHDLEQEKKLNLCKTLVMPNITDKISSMDKLSGEDRLDLKFTFNNNDYCYSILYLEKEKSVLDSTI